MTEIEEAFNGAGKAVGLELWRIEKLKPVKQPKVDGKFHVGDSYILLSTTTKGSKLVHNIHFWLGKDTSDDEAGCAAYKTIELDGSLGGGPVQYREVQGSESPLFKSYFKTTGIEYVPGGVESGFRKVERDVYEPRLLHCKGARTVNVTEVPLTNKSLNKGDVFILDLGLQIYIFNGPKANRAEKAKGVEKAGRINSDERRGRAEIIFVEDDPQIAAFWEPLGGYIDSEMLPEGDADSTVVAVKVLPKLLKLDDFWFVNITPIDSKLSKDSLKSNGIFLVHSTKLYLWIGETATLEQKKEATSTAIKYMTANNIPKSTSLERVSEGVETNAFKAEFSKWEIVVKKNSGVASMGEDKNIDIKELLARKTIQDTPVDDGSGKVEIWVVRDFKLEEVNPLKYGQFFGGDSYVIQYTYVKNKVENYIIYFWLGNKSSADEKGSAALLAKEKDDALGGKPVQVRVVQGKEPAHFHQLFKGKMVVHAGGRASSFKNSTEKDTYDTDGTALFRVKGTNALNTVAVQVAEMTSSLNSEDCFVLVTSSYVYSWHGKGSTADEQAVALNIAKMLSTDYNGKTSGRIVEAVKEGAEPEAEQAVYAALGGKTAYASSAPGESAPKDPRLFSCSNATGSFNVQEVADFNQTDLNDEDVFLLDTYTTVYLWVGSQANTAEKEKSFEFAQKFVNEANDGRDNDCPIMVVRAGREPYMFTAQFVGWDGAIAESNTTSDVYLLKKEQVTGKKAVTAAVAVTRASEATAAGGTRSKSNSNAAQPSRAKSPSNATATGGAAAATKSPATTTKPAAVDDGGCCVIS